MAWSTAGEILRWWRTDVIGLSQQQAAERLSVKPSALSNWERGARHISIDLEQLDDLLEGGGALAGLLWALGTPEGVEPARVWTHVYPGPSTPVWIWVRSPSPALSIVGEWGVARMEPQLDLGDNGAFFTLGVSVAESPVVVSLSEPGWVDFGRGELPDTIPGAEVLSCLDLLTRSSANGTFMELFVGSMASKLKTRKSREYAALAAMAPKAVASFFSGLYKPKSPEILAWAHGQGFLTRWIAKVDLASPDCGAPGACRCPTPLMPWSNRRTSP